MLKIAPHANVACLFGLVLAPPALVLEFCDGGSLDQALGLEDPAHRRVFGDAECRHVALGVARGMAHLHAARIVHRDLASRNVLLRLSPLTAKVSDFGMSRIVDDDSSGQTMTLTGPIKWQAPEQFRGTPRQYSLKSDVFSFAVLLTELVGNCLPWPDVTNTVAAVAVHRGERTPVPERMAPLLRAVVGKCWAQAADVWRCSIPMMGKIERCFFCWLHHGLMNHWSQRRRQRSAALDRSCSAKRLAATECCSRVHAR